MAVVIGLVTYMDTAAQQRQSDQVQAEAAMTGALEEHLRLATQYPELAFEQTSFIDERYRIAGEQPQDLRPPGTHLKEALLRPKYSFFAAHAIFAAETIYIQVEGQDWATKENWVDTVKGLIERHKHYVCHDKAFPKEQYSRTFREFISKLRDKGLCDRKDLVWAPD